MTQAFEVTPEMLDKTSPCRAVVADATVSYAVGLVCVRQIGVFKVTKTYLPAATASFFSHKKTA